MSHIRHLLFINHQQNLYNTPPRIYPLSPHFKMSTIPATVKALVASPEGKAPSVVEIPFGAREAVKNLGPQYVAVSNRALGLNP